MTHLRRFSYSDERGEVPWMFIFTLSELFYATNAMETQKFASGSVAPEDLIPFFSYEMI